MPAISSARPTAAEPMSLTRPICGSIASVDAVGELLDRGVQQFHHQHEKPRPRSAQGASRPARQRRKATGIARTRATSSWRNASSLRAAASEAVPGIDGGAQQAVHGSATQPAPGQHVSPSARGSRLPSSNNANGGNSLRLRRANSRRPGAYLDRSSRLERFAVEIEHHDLVLDHALHEECAVVLAPGEPRHQWPTLASVSGTNSLPLTLSTFTSP